MTATPINKARYGSGGNSLICKGGKKKIKNLCKTENKKKMIQF